MQNAIEPMSRECAGNQRIDADVAAHDLGARPGQIGFLDSRIVTVVEIIKHHHLMTLREERLRQMRTDETGTTGAQEFSRVG